ncbi:hypothetical protein GQ457_09G015530 [Hibiscus cannabinus]
MYSILVDVPKLNVSLTQWESKALSLMLSHTTLLCQECVYYGGQGDRGLNFCSSMFSGYGSMYEQWGGYALFWSILDSSMLLAC